MGLPYFTKFETKAQIASEIDAQIINSTAISDPNAALPLTGNVHILGVGPGTYTYWGNQTVPASNIATLRRVDGAFSMSLTPIEIPTSESKLWTNTTGYPADTDRVWLGKLWKSNAATTPADIPGTSIKWVELLRGYSDEIKNNTTKSNLYRGDELFNYEGYVRGVDGVFVSQISNNVASDFIELTPNDTLTATKLQSLSTTLRQATFFNSSKIFISSYNDDDLTTINLNSENIPANTAFVVLNRNKTESPTFIIKNDIKSNLGLTEIIDNDILDKENVHKLETGVDLFTIIGFYVNKTTGALDANTGFKCTDYIKLNSSNIIVATELAVAGAFRQASFFNAKSASGLISSYTTNDLSDVTLDFNNIPLNAKYVRFNTALALIPTLATKKHKFSSVAPLKVKTAAWDTINPVSGYSSHYGKYWNGNSYVNNDSFQFLLYAVTAGQNIHVRGNSDTGNNPIVVFFNSQNIEVGNFVANSTIAVINGIKFYDAKQVVPLGATHAIVQQRRLLKLNPPFAQLVKITDEEQVDNKIVLIGDSFSQMAGHAEELMSLIKLLHPEYDIFNFGIGGEKTNEILSRVGAFQMYLTPSDTFTILDADTGSRYFTLPYTTATVEIGANSIANSWNSEKLNLLAQTTPTTDCEPQTVLIDGVECLLTKVSASYFLNRTVASDSTKKVFVGAEMICYNIPKLNKDDIAIVNTHQNGGWTDVTDLVAQVQRLVDSLGTKKYIVLSSHYAQNDDTISLTSVTQRIVQETALRKAFGAKYINMREYFTTRAVIDALATPWWNNDSYPTDTLGETHPDATDVSYMSTGRFAPMFWPNPNNNSDVIHLSRRSYAIYYGYIFKRIIALKYLSK